MGYMAKWGPKGFLVSPTKIVPFDGFSCKIALKSDTGASANGTDTTNVRGRDKQIMTFTTTYISAAGVDPRAQVDAWEAEIGNSYPLIIGGKQFGPEKMMLSSVDVSDLQLDNNGNFLSVSLTITLEEYSTEAAAAALTAAEIAQKAAEAYSAKVEQKRAMDAKPTTIDKAQKKNTGTEVAFS